jgi:hypothetical protein
MYTVRADDENRRVLYQVGNGDFLVVAWFADQADAEFAKEAFERRSAGDQQLLPPSPMNDPLPDHITPARA